MVSPVINMPCPLGKAWPMSGRATQLFTQHSGETPLRGGFAQSLTHASNTDPNYQASWHSFVDPIARVRQIPWNLGAWTQGLANGFAIGIEIAGYAAFTEAQWLTPEGLKQMENLAHEWVYYWRIEKSQGNHIELRWLTDNEVRAVMNGNRDIKGFCTHGQIEPATRWDPGPNFPKTMLMNRIKQLIGVAPAPTKPAEIPLEDVLAQVTSFSKEALVQLHNAVVHGTPGAKLILNRETGKGEWLESAVGSQLDRVKAILDSQHKIELNALTATQNKLITALGKAAGISPEEIKKAIAADNAHIEKLLVDFGEKMKVEFKQTVEAADIPKQVEDALVKSISSIDTSVKFK